MLSVPMQKLKIKVVVKAQGPGDQALPEVLELSKQAVVLRATTAMDQVQIVLWMKVLGKEGRRSFELKNLTRTTLEADGTAKYTFQVDQYGDFSRCFDFSRSR